MIPTSVRSRISRAFLSEPLKMRVMDPSIGMFLSDWLIVLSSNLITLRSNNSKSIIPTFCRIHSRSSERVLALTVLCPASLRASQNFCCTSEDPWQITTVLLIGGEEVTCLDANAFSSLCLRAEPRNLSLLLDHFLDGYNPVLFYVSLPNMRYGGRCRPV